MAGETLLGNGEFIDVRGKLRVANRALTAKQIGRAAGLDIPNNLAAGAKVTATASDSANGLTPDLATDEEPKSRGSSGPTHAEQSLAIDLGTGSARPGHTTANFPPATVPHVRMVMNHPVTPRGYSIHHVDILATKRSG